MDNNFDRKKEVNLWEVKQYYHGHLSRLENLMNSSNPSKHYSHNPTLSIMHQSHQASLEPNQKCTRRQIKKDSMKFTEFKQGMSLPRLGRNLKRKSPKHRKPSPIKYDQLLQNMILYNKITKVESQYQKKDLDRSFQKVCQIKNTLKRKPYFQTASNFYQRLFRESILHQSLYPDQTYTHIQKVSNRAVSDELRLKFDLLPIPYHLEVRTSLGRSVTSSKLVQLNQLKKDIFVFKIPKKRIEELVVVLKRFKNHNGNAIGMFIVKRGDHVATQLKSCLGTISTQFLCYTSWNRACRKQKGIRIVVGKDASGEKQNIFIDELDNSQLSSIQDHNQSICKEETFLQTTDGS